METTPSIIPIGHSTCRSESAEAGSGPRSNDQPRETQAHDDRIEVPIHSHLWRNVESRLVAEPAAARYPAPAFLAVESDGRGLQLRCGIQEPRPGSGED